ncbi:MAG: hypothetical protein U0451_01970 [Candidatus Saccharimonadales bacterium]
MSHNTDLGTDLIEQFKNALILRSTVQYAKEEAERSEQATVQGLDAISRGAYLNPSVVPVDLQSQLTRASVDAHIKKVQANQIDQSSRQQMIELQENANKKYIGRKVIVTILNGLEKPVESIWLNPSSGQYYSGVLNTKSVTGTIEEVMLEKNALLLKPHFWSRVGAKNRKYFLIYVISPNTLEAFVKFDIR